MFPALGTVEGIDSDEEEENEATEPTRDNVGRNYEADPGNNHEEDEGDINLEDEGGNFPGHINLKPTGNKLSFWIRWEIYNCLLIVKIFYHDIILQLSLLSWRMDF